MTAVGTADEEEPTTAEEPAAEDGNTTIGVVPTGGPVEEGAPPPVPVEPEPEDNTTPAPTGTTTVGEPWNP